MWWLVFFYFKFDYFMRSLLVKLGLISWMFDWNSFLQMFETFSKKVIHLIFILKCFYSATLLLVLDFLLSDSNIFIVLTFLMISLYDSLHHFKLIFIIAHFDNNSICALFPCVSAWTQKNYFNSFQCCTFIRILLFVWISEHSLSSKHSK